jgi:hypothetical protein
MIAPPVIGPLVAGLLVAFGFQLLLVNVGIAMGIAFIKFLPGAKTEAAEPTAQPSNRPIRAVGVAIALAILITLNIVLFVACFLAVRLSGINSLVSGAILALVIWSAYFLILSWLGSTAIGTVSSLIQKLVSVSWQGISAGTQTVVSKVVERVSVSSQRFQDEIAGYLLYASREQFSRKDIQNKLQEITTNSELDAKSLHKQLTQLKRDELVAVLHQRNDLSEKKIDKIADRLQTALFEIIEQTEATLTTDAAASSDGITQSLQLLNLAAIDLEEIQAEIFSFFKKYPFLAPKLIQLLFQIDWQQWLGTALPGDHLAIPSGLTNPIDPLQEKTTHSLENLKQGTLRRFTGIYNLTAAASGWLSGIALTSLISAAIAGALAAYSFRILP